MNLAVLYIFTTQDYTNAMKNKLCQTNQPDQTKTNDGFFYPLNSHTKYGKVFIHA
jgi:hypothetical protein